MFFVLFSVFGDDFKVLEFVETFRLTQVDIAEKGKISTYGKRSFTHPQSGFSISFSEQKDEAEVSKNVENFIHANIVWLKSLQSLEVELLFSIGITVGSKESYAPSIDFSASLLELLGRNKIKLKISCYPTSDDEQIH